MPSRSSIFCAAMFSRRATLLLVKRLKDVYMEYEMCVEYEI